jgi:hypothetical protein
MRMTISWVSLTTVLGPEAMIHDPVTNGRFEENVHTIASEIKPRKQNTQKVAVRIARGTKLQQQTKRNLFVRCTSRFKTARCRRSIRVGDDTIFVDVQIEVGVSCPKVPTLLAYDWTCQYVLLPHQ